MGGWFPMRKGDYLGELIRGRWGRVFHFKNLGAILRECFLLGEEVVWVGEENRMGVFVLGSVLV